MAPAPGGLAPAEGRLLVASPVIGEATFFRTVILLLEHTDDAGSLGVVLNRPTELRVADAIPGWQDVVSPPDLLFTGGPVSEGSALGLALVDGVADGSGAAGAAGSADADPGGITALFGQLALVDLEQDAAVLQPRLHHLRLYSGYAGWGPGQLRGEVWAGAWWVFESDPSDWFSTEPAELWPRVLRRQGGSWRMWANAPEDPEVN